MTTPTDKSEVPVDLDYESLVRERNHLQSQLTDLRAQVERLHADGAVMRGALRELKIRICYIGMPQEPFWMDGGRKVWDWRRQIKLLEEALHGNDLGRDLLARYREAVELLMCDPPNPYRAKDWLTRRDTLLATAKGEVEL